MSKNKKISMEKVGGVSAGLSWELFGRFFKKVNDMKNLPLKILIRQ